MPVITPFPEKKLENVRSVSWVGGFHHSYYWAKKPEPIQTAIIAYWQADSMAGLARP